MSPYRSPRNWLVLSLAAVIALSFLVSAWSFRQASRSGDRTREALCQVLLFARTETLNPQPPQPPPTASQVAAIEEFYGQVTGLVEGCHLPKETS